MKRVKPNGSFFLCLLFNLVFNIEWTIPAWILLILHFALGWSIWWFWGAIAAWLIVVVCWVAVISFAVNSSSPETPRENKNPYSATTQSYLKPEDVASTDRKSE